jgi:hypothetical protein
MLDEAARFLWNGFISEDGIGVGPAGMLSGDLALTIAGSTVEVKLKAMKLAGYSWPIHDSEYKTVARGAHDLVELARGCGCQTNKADREVLAALSHHVRWRTRYPVPRTIDEFHHEARTAHDRSTKWNAYCALKSKNDVQAARRIKVWSKRTKRLKVKGG